MHGRDRRPARLATVALPTATTFTKGQSMNTFQTPAHLMGPTPMQEFQKMHRENIAAQQQTHELLRQVLAALQDLKLADQPASGSPPASS